MFLKLNLIINVYLRIPKNTSPENNSKITFELAVLQKKFKSIAL